MNALSDDKLPAILKGMANMEETRTAYKAIKDYGKWMGGTALGLVFAKFFNPALDWAIESLLWLTDLVSNGINDTLYRNAAMVHREPTSTYILMALIVAFAAHLIYRHSPARYQYQTTTISRFLLINGYGLFVAALAIFIGNILSERIQATTLSQLDIIRPYTENTDTLYSQFLLIQTEDDYKKVWTDIKTIAERENVVLPVFAKLQ